MSATLEVRDGVAVVTLDNPPVNSLGLSTRAGIAGGLARALEDPRVVAIVLAGSKRAFSGGADIREFATGDHRKPPYLPDLLAQIEGAAKPVVAAIGGLALGGGCELALACHYRVAVPGVPIGLPEVKLGILPGAGGTQRMPRLIGAAHALDMIVSGTPAKSEELAKLGLVDRLADPDRLVEDAIAFAREVAASGRPIRRVGELAVPADSMPGGADAFFAEARRRIGAASPGQPAPLRCVDAVEAAVRQPLAQGLALESRLCGELMQSPEAKALQYSFFAERTASKIPDVPEGTPVRPIARAAVIGAGMMGGGIAMCFANAGLPVLLVEASRQALDRGIGVIRSNYEASVKRGRLAPQQLERAMGLITPSLSIDAAADADIVVEAVFEDMQVKLDVFGRLDAVAKPGAILATNTSMLDVDAIARATRRPQDVVGTHFFSPANVMRLLEVVRGEATAKDVLATTMALAKRIGKVGVVAGVCDGFIGNRMLAPYVRQAGLLVEEGALPHQVDAALERFGFAMGPFRMIDLAGLDTHQRVSRRQYVEYPQYSWPRWFDRVHDLGRHGQKTGAGFHRYEPGGRKAIPDPVVEDIVRHYSADKGIARRAIGDDEIVERCVLALVNEGAHVLEGGFAQRASDIDVVYVAGYGFPAHRGGPMYYADRLGLASVVAAMERHARNPQADPVSWKPAPLLARLAAEGRALVQGASR